MAVKQTLSVTQKSQNAEKNRSTVRIRWQSTQSGESHNLNERTAYYWISVNGGAETRHSVSYTLPKNATKTILDIAVNVDHDDNGKGSIKIRTWMDTRISAGEITKSKSLTLATIARESAIGATDANIGSTTSIVVARKNAAYTHTVAFEFGALSGYLDADGNTSTSPIKLDVTSIAWKLPTTFYNQIPDAKQGVCTLRIKTYSGNSQIGVEKTATFAVKTSKSSCAPVVSGTVEDTRSQVVAVTGDPSVMVRYMSTAKCTISATAKNSASITQKTIAGKAVSGTTRSIAEIDQDAVEFYALDSRGYATTAKVSFALIPYIPITINATGDRTDPTSGNALIKVKGNYFNGSFGAVDNSLRLQYRVISEDGKTTSYSEVVPKLSANSYSIDLAVSGLDYKQAHEIEIQVEDALEKYVKFVPIRRGIPVYDWGEGDFRINAALRVGSNNYGSELPKTGKAGQVFFLLGNPITLHIHDGEKWMG